MFNVDMNKTETLNLRAYTAPQCEVNRISLEGNLLVSKFNAASTAIESYEVKGDDEDWE